MIWARELLASVGVFGMVIMVHEFGHFLAAKATGVTVPLVSIGMGPAIWQRRWGETVYRIALLPVGGFVRLASRDTREESSGTGRVFDETSLITRLTILSAGVGMNLLFGVLIFASLAATWHDPVRQSAVFGGLSTTTPALRYALPLEPGDTILAVDGHRVATWDAVVARVAVGTGKRVVFSVRARTATVDLIRLGESHIRFASLMESYRPPSIGPVTPRSMAAIAGLRQGDSIVAIDGHATRSWSEVRQGIAEGEHHLVVLSIVRTGRSLTIPLQTNRTNRVLSAGASGGASGGASALGAPRVSDSIFTRLGIASRPATAWVTVSPLQALYRGGRATEREVHDIIVLIGRLLTGHVSLTALEGPVAIAQQSAQAARHGIADVLALIGYLSINIAVMNLLLPLPLLDGGQIFLTLVERVRGVALSPRVTAWLMYSGGAVIVVLSCVLLVHDTLRILTSR